MSPTDQDAMNAATIDTVKHIGDVAALTIAIGTLISWLPPIAALLTIIYTAIRIFESETVGRLIGRKK